VVFWGLGNNWGMALFQNNVFEDERIEGGLNLNELLVKRPAATFYFRVVGGKGRNEGIEDGDLLIVDRSLSPVVGKIVVGAQEGELVVKKLVGDERQFEVWGVVTCVIHPV
jgi:DNA polymerase V